MGYSLEKALFISHGRMPGVPYTLYKEARMKSHKKR